MFKFMFTFAKRGFSQRAFEEWRDSGKTALLQQPRQGAYIGLYMDSANDTQHGLRFGLYKVAYFGLGLYKDTYLGLGLHKQIRLRPSLPTPSPSRWT